MGSGDVGRIRILDDDGGIRLNIFLVAGRRIGSFRHSIKFEKETRTQFKKFQKDKEKLHDVIV